MTTHLKTKRCTVNLPLSASPVALVDSCGGVAVPVVTIRKVLMRMGYRLMGVGMPMPDASRTS